MPQSEEHFQRIEQLKARLRGMFLLFLVLISTAVVSNGSVLITRKLWMDEIHSWLLVTDKSTSHAMLALADGADFNPPSWFLVTRTINSLTGQPSERFLRFLSLFWMLSALGGLYLILAKLFDWKVSFAAVILTASHPLLIHQSTEIRFYGFWCACVVWLCYVLQWEPESNSGRRLQWLLIAGLSLLVATSHWFGILSLALIAAPLVMRQNIDVRGYGRALVILASGMTGVCACLPFLYGQKAAISRPTWISPATVSDTIQFLNYLFPAWQILLCIGAAVAGIVLARRTMDETIVRELPENMIRLLPFPGLTLMPFVIVVVAWIIQPSLVARYAIVGLFGIAPIYAVLLHQSDRRLQRLMLAASIVGFSYSVSSYGRQWNDEQRYQLSLLQQLRQCPADAMVVFEDRIAWMPLKHHYPELAHMYRFANFSDTALNQDSALRIVQRDAGRRIEKWYPAYQMLSPEALTQRSVFYVVPYANEQPGIQFPEGYLVGRFSDSILRYQLQSTQNSDEASVVPPVAGPEAEPATRKRISIARKIF